MLVKKYFDCVQYFLIVLKSDILPYKLAYLSVVKNIWLHSKNVEQGQNFLNTTNFFLNSRWIRHEPNWDYYCDVSVLLKVWHSSEFIKCLLLFHYRHVNACLKGWILRSKWARSYLHLDHNCIKISLFAIQRIWIIKCQSYLEFAYVLIMEINDAKKILLSSM